MNWVLLDEKLQPYHDDTTLISKPEFSGYEQVGEPGKVTKHAKKDWKIERSGYVYIFSNNLDEEDVFFENFTVITQVGPILEVNHTYPFGVTIDGISGQASGRLENRIRFNGYEQQSKEFSDGSGLEWYDYKHRFYDNQLGRFFSVDRLADKYPFYSVYQFAGNEVPNVIDQDGLEPAYTVIKNGRPSSMPAGDNLRRPIPASHQADFNRSMGGTFKGGGGANPLILTDVNDATVLATWLTRGGNAVNIDGSAATGTDKFFAVVGAAVPFVSGSFIKSLFKPLLSEGNAAIEVIAKKVGNLSTALDEKHIKAAVGDILGNPVVINGKTYDHLTEVENALKGLGGQLDKLNGVINSGDLAGDVLKSAENLRSTLQKQKDAITNTLENARKQANQQ